MAVATAARTAHGRRRKGRVRDLSSARPTCLRARGREVFFVPIGSVGSTDSSEDDHASGAQGSTTDTSLGGAPRRLPR